MPENDLLTESIIVSAKKPNSWVLIDLSDKNEWFDEDGIVVAVEFIYTEEKYFHRRSESDRSYRPSIGSLINMNKDVNRTYSFNGITKNYVWSSGSDYLKYLAQSNYSSNDNRFGYIEFLINMDVFYY